MDIAVCTTILNPFTNKVVNDHIRPVSINPRLAILDGTPVAFTGFPLGFLFPVTSKGYVGGYAPFSDRLVIDKSAWPGASGSIVYNGDGDMMGMITEAGIDYGSGLAYALPVNSILKFLTDNKVRVEK
jgi:S1-C subfamily serine protease